MQKSKGLIAFVLLHLMLFLPSWVTEVAQHLLIQGSQPDEIFTLAWFSVDLFLISVILFASRGWKYCPQVKRFLAILFGMLVLYEFYSKSVLVFAHRTPILINDIHLITDSFYLIFDMFPFAWPLILLSILGMAVAIFALIPILFRWLDEGIADIRHLSAVIIPGTLILLGIVLSHQIQHTRLPDAPAQIIAGRVKVNVTGSINLYRKMYLNEHQESVIGREFPKKDTLVRRPDIYLVVIESYGSVLMDSEEYRSRYTTMLTRVERKLVGDDWYPYSGYSKSPTIGGRSWLAMASLMSGSRIETQVSYNYLKGLEGFPFVEYMQLQGYRTILMQPPNRPRPGIPLENIYGFDTRISFKDLDYKGPEYGWGIVPDQYSLFIAEQNYLTESDRPFFFCFTMVSSHGRWEPETLPPYLPKIETESGFFRGYQDSTEAIVAQIDSTNFLRGSLRATNDYYPFFIRYEFEVLLNHILQRIDDQSIIVIIGDHQPPLLVNSEASHEVPVHILSRDSVIPGALQTANFIPGMIPNVSPGKNLRHSDIPWILRDLLLESTE